jgi:CRISPR-associated endonuclease/helicase Cas3
MIVEYQQGKKVLIVCNTIDDAIHLYRLIRESVPNTQTLLYHSRFINIHKSAKEENLEEANNSNRPFIAVCTQIVEVSLDINFDVLFSENAPVDALVQRMGRVNRYADKSLAKVVICRESDKSARVYEESLLKSTWSELTTRATQRSGTLTERDYREIVNSVYNSRNLSAKYRDELQEGKCLIQDLWRERTSAIFTINSDDKHLYAKTRLEKYGKVDVVLQQHMTTVQQLVDKRQFSEINDWIIKIPAWWLRKLAVERIGDDLTVVKCDYSQELGAQYSEDSSNFVG